MINDAAKDNLYQYNGKELNLDHGLNWSDYGARFYDACVGRWSSVDPMANLTPSHSSYSYALNNPMKFNDPSGMVASSTQELIETVWAQGNGTYDNNGNRIEEKSSESDPPIDNFLLSKIIVHAWWALEDGFANLTVAPYMNNVRGAKSIRKIAKEKYGTSLSSISDYDLENGVRIKWINGEPELVPQSGFFEKLIENGVDVLNIAAAFYGGGSGIIAAKVPGNFKGLTDDFLKQLGFDAHAIKMEYLGNKARIAQYQLYQNTDTKNIWIFSRKNPNPIMETSYKIE